MCTADFSLPNNFWLLSRPVETWMENRFDHGFPFRARKQQDWNEVLRFKDFNRTTLISLPFFDPDAMGKGGKTGLLYKFKYQLTKSLLVCVFLCFFGFCSQHAFIPACLRVCPSTRADERTCVPIRALTWTLALQDSVGLKRSGQCLHSRLLTNYTHWLAGLN